MYTAFKKEEGGGSERRRQRRKGGKSEVCKQERSFREENKEPKQWSRKAKEKEIEGTKEVEKKNRSWGG